MNVGKYSFKFHSKVKKITFLFWCMPIQVVRMQFITLQTESNYDYVRIYDGSGTNSPSLGESSGSSLPTNIQSSSNELYIKFTSDSSNSGDGFKAVVTADGKYVYTFS